jgi:hypothetical protein
MKKQKDENGNHYIFSTDKGLEKLCITLIQITRDIDTTMSFVQKLWEAAFAYVEICDDDSMIFKRKPDLSDKNKLDDDVYEWLNLAITTITKTLDIKEKYINPTFKGEKMNKSGVGYKIDTNGNIYSYNILLPNTYLKISKNDFKKMLNNIQTEFDDLHCQKHYRMFYDIKLKMKSALKLYPSIEIVYELPKTTKKQEKELEFKFSNAEITKRIKTQSSTISVFDGLENFAHNN